MGIKQNPNGTWTVSYTKRHPITRQPVSLRRKGIPTRAEAQRVRDQLIVEVEGRLHRAVSPLWLDVLARFEEDCANRGLSLKTIENCVTSLRKHTSDWNESTVDSIQVARVRELVVQRMSGYSDSHRKNMLKHLKGAFTFAADNGWITRVPVPNIKFRVGDKLKGTLTEPQVRRFLDEAKNLDSFWYPHWATALYTGLRNGELYALRWDRVNLTERLITVDSAWNNKDGFKSTKSGNDRMVEIAPGLLPGLKELKLRTGAGEFVLPRRSQWDKGEQARELRKFLAGLGLPPIRFHDLRATWATLLLTRGVEPIRVMKMGGWSDMKTMMIYVRKAGVDIRGATDSLTLHDGERRTANVLNFERA